MKNLAIIPIRCGSKGIRDKNIRKMNGLPLVAYTIRAALDSKMFSKVMVSTDSIEYAEIAKQYGAEVPFMRSAENSTDTASSWAVVDEVLKKYAEMGETFDSIALLQVTSPLRRPEDIINGYQLLDEKKANAIIAVCETETSLNICGYLPEDTSLVNFIGGAFDVPRQKQQKAYRINGALYLYKTDAMKRQKTIYDEKCYAYIMDRMYSSDIDEEIDFLTCEAIMNYIKEHQ